MTTNNTVVQYSMVFYSAAWEIKTYINAAARHQLVKAALSCSFRAVFVLACRQGVGSFMEAVKISITHNNMMQLNYPKLWS